LDMDDLQIEDMHLPPPIFSKIDNPQDYAFQANPNFKLQEPDQNPMGIKKMVTKAKRAPTNTTYVDFYIDRVPAESGSSITIRNSEGEARIKKLFEDRPIWIKRALLDHLLPEDHKDIKHLMAMSCYCFNNGPWRKSWVRYGYDPRRDPEARFYQVIDFRVDASLVLRLSKSEPKKRTPFRLQKQRAIDVVQLMQSLEDPPPSVPPSTPLPLTTELSQDQRDESQMSDAAKEYTFSIPPAQRQTLYQLCDINDEQIQNILRRHGRRAVCDERTGWFNKATIEKITTIMKEKVKVWVLATRETNQEEEVTQIDDPLQNEDIPENIPDMEGDQSKVVDDVGFLQTLMKLKNSEVTAEVIEGEMYEPYDIFGDENESSEEEF